MSLPEKIHLQVVTPERSVVNEEVDYVHLPGVEGYLGVLPGHTPLLTSLKIGEIEYHKGPLHLFLAVKSGLEQAAAAGVGTPAARTTRSRP